MTYPTYHPVSTTIAPTSTPTPVTTTRPKVYFSYNNSYITEKTTYVGSYLNVSCYISNPSNMQLYPEYYNSNSYVASSYFRNNILYINAKSTGTTYTGITLNDSYFNTVGGGTLKLNVVPRPTSTPTPTPTPGPKYKIAYFNLELSNSYVAYNGDCTYIIPNIEIDSNSYFSTNDLISNIHYIIEDPKAISFDIDHTEHDKVTYDATPVYIYNSNVFTEDTTNEITAYVRLKNGDTKCSKLTIDVNGMPKPVVDGNITLDKYYARPGESIMATLTYYAYNDTINRIDWTINSSHAYFDYFVNDKHNTAYIKINNCDQTTYLHINADLYTNRGLLKNVHTNVLLDKLPVDSTPTPMPGLTIEEKDVLDKLTKHFAKILFDKSI